MKTTTTTMRGILLVVLWQAYALCSFAQIAPYTIPPRWMFGFNGGMNFPGFTGAPVTLAGNPTTPAVYAPLETSSSACDPSGALTFYSNSAIIYNGANAVVRNMNAVNAIAGVSATNGCVIIPDPAAPATQYYIFIANDLSAGLQPNKGIFWYRLSTATGVMSGPNNIAGGSEVDESLCAGTDGEGGYWIVSHEVANNYFWVWHVTTGGVSAVSKQQHSPYVGGTVNGSAKISRCQDKLAWTGNNSLVVYPWNRETGTITNTAIFSNVLGMGAGFSEPTYGIEFSPDGSKVYHTVLGNQSTTAGILKQIDLNTGTMVTVASGSVNGGSEELGTMQLGPDGKIYVTNVADGTTGAIYIGVINTPNAAGAAACSYNASGFLLKPANASTLPSIYRGIVNEAWMSPEVPAINITGSTDCERNFALVFETYFNQTINLNTSTIEWNFGDGVWRSGLGASTTFNYNTIQTPGTTVARTVRIRFNDQICNHEWEAQNSVSITCPLPVTWLDFDGKYENTKVKLNWSTASELNNEYFSVERSSDGIHFTPIAQVRGKGNSNSIQEYSFTDVEPSGDGAYYRITQHDIDGEYEHSKIIFVQTAKLFVQVSPNPSNNDFHLRTNHPLSLTVAVKDALGRTVYEKELPEGEQHLFFGAEFSEGSYTLQVISASDSYVEKLVKK